MNHFDYTKITGWERLNDREKRYVLARVAAPSSAAAAREAGYSHRHTERLDGDPRIFGVLKQLRDQLFEDVALSKAEALALLSREARSTIADVMDECGNLDPVLVKKNGHAVKNFAAIPGKDGVGYRADAADHQGAIALFAKIAGWLDKATDNHTLGEVKISVNLPQRIMNDER